MLRDLREAFRAVRSRPGVTIVVVATLALAIGANTALFSVLNGVLLRPLPYPRSDELVIVWERNETQGIEESEASTGNYRDWREQASAFDGKLAAYRRQGNTLTGLDRPERIDTVLVSPTVFSVLGVEARLGRTFAPAEETPGNEKLLLLGHEAWERRFGADPDIVASRVLMDSEPYTVVGVMPEGFEFPPGEPEVEAWLPLTLSEQAQMDRAHRMYHVIGRLAGGATIGAAQREMDAIAAQIAEQLPQTNAGWGVELVPARRQVVGEIAATLWILFGAVTLVLLIGCVNVANVLIARSSEVSKDYVIRAALGAGRYTLLRRSLAESMVLAASGGLAGLLVATWGVDVLRTVIPDSVPRGSTIGIDLGVLAFAATVTLGSGLLFGILPALRITTYNVAEALKSGGGHGVSGGRRARWISDAMIVLEVALALMLLAGAGLLIRSFASLSRVDPGYRQEGVVAMSLSLPPSRYADSELRRQFYRELVGRVRATPDIGGAGAVNRLPMSALGTDFEMPFTVLGLESESPTERPRADYRGVIPDYIRTMGIPLIRGRLFDDFDGGEGREVTIVNQALARRYFPDQDPIGKVLRMAMAGDLEIVGIVGDVRHGGLQSEVRPELYVPYRQLPLSDMTIAAYSTLATDQVTRLIEEELVAMDPELAPIEVVTIEDLLAQSIAQPRFNMAMLVGLAICAALLAAVGIYGVVSHSVAQRTGEIGVRMALGASAGDAMALIVRQALWVVGLGVVLGVAGALGASRFIAGLLFGVAATDPATYLAVGAIIIVLGALAATIPARRATAVDPVIALRDE